MSYRLPTGWFGRLQELGKAFETGDWNAFSAVEGFGPIARLEQTAVEVYGGGWALAVSNATSALITALVAGGIKGGDEVIVPAYGWPQTVFPVLVLGALPIPVDCSPDSPTVDPAAAELAINGRTTALIAAHLYGYSCDVEALGKVANRNGLLFIVDAAQGAGIRYRDGLLADHADLTAISFGRGKQPTCGEGGLLLGKGAVHRDRAFLCSQHPLRSHHELADLRLAASVTGLSFNFRLHPWIAALMELAIREVTTRNREPLPITPLTGFTPDRELSGSIASPELVSGTCIDWDTREAYAEDQNGRYERGRVHQLTPQLLLRAAAIWEGVFRFWPCDQELPNASRRLRTELLVHTDRYGADPVMPRSGKAV